MKAFFETNTINRLTDRPDYLKTVLEARDCGCLTVLIAVESVTEVQATPDDERRRRLMATIAHFSLTPTRHPRLGALPLGLGRVEMPNDAARIAALRFLKDLPDQYHASNAGGEGCDYFVTDDGEMLEDKRIALEGQIGVRVIGLEGFCNLLRLRRDDAAQDGQGRHCNH